MSTHKTPNYKLHKWESQDDFLRTEFNENFAKIDAEALRIIFGVYTGAYSFSNTTLTKITLGSKPKAVMIVPYDGTCSNSGGRSYDAIAGAGYPAAGGVLTLDETGFSVYNRDTDYVYLNQTGKTYYYMAFV